MTRYEYKVVPAPSKGLKSKTAKTPEARFALGVETELNRMGAEGWEFLRAELLPSDERSGLTGTAQHWRNLLVFRRALADPDGFAAPDPAPEAAALGTPEPESAAAPETMAAPQAPRPAPDPAGDDDRTVARLPPLRASRTPQPLTVVADRDGKDDRDDRS